MALDGISGFCAKVRHCRGSPGDAHLGAKNNLCSEPERVVVVVIIPHGGYKYHFTTKVFVFFFFTTQLI